MSGTQELTASLVDSVAWPIAVILIVFVLKKPLGAALANIRRAKGYGVEVEFGERADAARDDAKAVLDGLEQQGVVTETSVDSATASAEVRRDEDPSFAVVASWELVSSAVRELYGASGLTGLPSTASTRRRVEALHRAGLVDDTYVSVVRELVDLRNVVAQGQQRVTHDQARAYVEAANEIVRASRALAAHLASPAQTAPGSAAP